MLSVRRGVGDGSGQSRDDSLLSTASLQVLLQPSHHILGFVIAALLQQPGNGVLLLTLAFIP